MRKKLNEIEQNFQKDLLRLKKEKTAFEMEAVSSDRAAGAADRNTD